MISLYWTTELEKLDGFVCQPGVKLFSFVKARTRMVLGLQRCTYNTDDIEMEILFSSHKHIGAN